MVQHCLSVHRLDHPARPAARLVRRALCVLLLAMMSTGSAASAQETVAPTGTTTQPPVQPDGTIIVLGGDLPADIKVLGFFRSFSRGMSANSQMFLRCAELPDGKTLSTILDGSPQRRRTQSALHRYIQQNEGCYPGINRSFEVPELGRCNPVLGPPLLSNNLTICRVLYDRGALYEQALLQQAGILDLRWEDTFDPEVRARFMRRENVRNDGRAQMDRDYFDTIACMVQISPQQGIAVVEAEPGSGRETDAVAMLVGHGSPCVGYVKNVKFDQVQFRAYVAEAVYSWIAAKRDVGSLVLGGVTIGG